MIRRAAALLALALAAVAAEPLVCRGFAAGVAADAIAGRTGHLVVPAGGPGPADARPVWFALVDDRQDTAAQALAHASGSTWSIGGDGNIHLDGSPRLVPGRQGVRSLPSLLVRRIDAETIARRLMDPWLGGDGGLVLDPPTGTWTATLDADGHARLTRLLGLLGSGEATAPDLLPDPDDPGPTLVLARAPAGEDLAAWAFDLARLAHLAVALGPGVVAASPAPAGPAANLGEARDRLAGLGYRTGIHHGCLAIGLTEPADRLHPAARAVLSQVPVGHLCPDDASLGALAAALTARVAPDAWARPGWGVVAVPWTHCLLIAADPATTHALIDAVDAADAAGLQAWLAQREGSRLEAGGSR